VRALVALALVSAHTGAALAAPGDADRLAGGPGVGPATSVAQVPNGLAVRNGALYVSDDQWFAVRRIDLATGHEEIVAGAGPGEGLGDGGPATAAHLFGPAGIAFDASGNLLIADTLNRRIRRVDAADGIITTVAGSDVVEHAGDGGPATEAGFSYPTDVAVAPNGDLFVVDTGSSRIRRVDAATGLISTFAGTGEAAFSGDGGPATSASFSHPSAIAFDAAGRLLVADRYDQYTGHRIRRVEADGTIDSIYVRYYGGRIVDLAVAADGTLYLTKDEASWVVRVADGWPVTVSGTWRGFWGDGGPASNSAMDSTYGLAFDESGNLFVADRGNRRVRRIDHASQTITTIAGNGSCCSGGDGGEARLAQVGNDQILGHDLSGNVLMVNRWEPRVRRIDVRTGRVDTIAGSGVSGFSGDGGPAVEARLYAPMSAVGDARGNVFVSDTGNHRIRRVDGTTGVITTIGGNGGTTRASDGALARTSPIGLPAYLALDRDGNLYYSERASSGGEVCSIRRIDAGTGTLATVIGGSGCSDHGDGGPAVAAGLVWHAPLALDPRGGLVFVDNNHVRRIDFATGRVERIFGNDELAFTPDGTPAAGSAANLVTSVGVDSAGNVYVGERDSFRVRRIDAVTGLLSTAIGTGVDGASGAGDGGPAPLAEISSLWSVAVTHSDRLYVAEGYPNRIRVVESGPRCGDWTIDPGESCDDGNLVDGDCCSPTCRLIGAGTVCRAGSGACDPAEICDGSSGLCPAPAFLAGGASCTSDDNLCTDDVCDGSGACSHPPARAGETCRASGGDCDVAEVCDGVLPDCPPDAFRPATQVCRAAANECDRAESCTGSSPQCPGNAYAAAGTSCTPDAATCTADVCDGAGACTHPAGNAGTACRAASGACDVAEVCDGVSAACPADVMKPVTAVCRVATGVCDVAETCDGVRAACPADALQPASVVCRASSAACDLAESCDGSSAACPGDGGQADLDGDGTCDAQDPCTNLDGERDFASPPRSVVVLDRVHADAVTGNDGLKLTASFALPDGRSFADLRPHMRGVRVVLEGAGGARRLDVTLTAGAYGAATRHGWKPGGAGTAWTYLDRRAAPANGIVKLTLTDRSRASAPRQAKVVVTGRNGAYSVTPADLPLQARLTLGDAADAAAGLCAESSYGATSCAFNRAGSQLVCTR